MRKRFFGRFMSIGVIITMVAAMIVPFSMGGVVLAAEKIIWGEDFDAVISDFSGLSYPALFTAGRLRNVRMSSGVETVFDAAMWGYLQEGDFTATPFSDDFEIVGTTDKAIRLKSGATANAALKFNMPSDFVGDGVLEFDFKVDQKPTPGSLFSVRANGLLYGYGYMPMMQMNETKAQQCTQASVYTGTAFPYTVGETHTVRIEIFCNGTANATTMFYFDGVSAGRANTITTQSEGFKRITALSFTFTDGWQDTGFEMDNIRFSRVLSDNAKLSALTFTPAGGSAAAVPNFSAADNLALNEYSVTLEPNTPSVSVAAALADAGAELTMDPPGGVLAGDIDGKSITVTATSADEEVVNVYKINFIMPVAVPATALEVTTANELNQPINDLRPITFTANPTPSVGVVTSDIEWYVEGDATPKGTGLTYVFNPPYALGEYRIYAKAGDVASESVVFTVVQPVHMEKVIFIEEYFTKRGEIGSAPDNFWLNNAPNAKIAEDPAAPGSGNKVLLSYPGASIDYGAQRINIDSMADQTRIFSGRMMMTENGGIDFNPTTRQSGTATNTAELMSFNKDGSISYGGANTGYKWVPNKWLRYVMYFKKVNETPTNTEYGLSLYLYGDMTKGGESEFYAAMPIRTFNLGVIEGAIWNQLMWRVITQGGHTAKLYLDDIEVYKPGTFYAAIKKNINVGLNDTVKVDFNYDIDATMMNADNITVTDESGGDIALDSAVLNKADFRSIELVFAQPLSSATSYTVSFDGIKNVMGEQILSVVFTTDVALPPADGFDAVTAISISAAGSMTQTYPALSTIDFTANTTPSENIDPNTITWYINGELAGTGLTLAHTPDTAGAYAVKAVTSGTVSSAETHFTIEKGTPVVTKLPTVKSLIAVGDTFNSAVKADGAADVPGTFGLEDGTQTPAANPSGYAKRIVFTPTDTANYNTVTLDDAVTIVVQAVVVPITAMSLNTPANLTQSAESLSKVDFVLTTTPVNDINEYNIEWYVNDTKQSAIGKQFSFTPTGSGIYNIYAKTEDGAVESGVKTINVGGVSEMVSVQSIAIDPKALTLWQDFPLPCVLKANVLPANATNTAVRWISQTPAVATVDAVTGDVKPVSVGTAVITAISTDGTNIESGANSFTLTVTPAKNRAANQQLNLPSTGTAGIDINKYLSWPSEVGQGQVALWSENRIGAYTISIDDNIRGDFADWKRFNDKYGFGFTFIVNSGGAVNELNRAEWAALIEKGNEIQSHTATHHSDTDAKQLTSAQTIYEYQKPIEIIEATTGQKVKTIGYSYGYGDLPYAREFYIGGRGTAGTPNQSATVNYIQTNSLSGFPTTDGKLALDGTNNTVEATVKMLYDTSYTYWGSKYYGGWVSFHFHSIHGGADVEAAMDKYVKPASDEGKIWVTTFTNAAMYGQERDSSTLTITKNTAEEIKYTLTDMMDDTMFDYPLSVKVRIPDDWENVHATQGGELLDLAEKTIDGKKYVMVETIPDRGEVLLTPGAPAVLAIADIELYKNTAGKYMVGANTTSTYASAQTVKFAVTIYNEGKLIDVKSISQNIPAGGGAITFEYSPMIALNPQYTAKVMAWDDDMQPYCAAEEKKVGEIAVK